MKKPELYHKTIDILVKAYLNDTLEHLNCYACAVGNMIAANMGIKIIAPQGMPELYKRGAWDCDIPYEKTAVQFLGSGYVKSQIHGIKRTDQIILDQVKATGYSFEELAQIEDAFETSASLENPRAFMYEGLMAVVEVLGEIHEVSKEVTESTKLQFVKP